MSGECADPVHAYLLAVDQLAQTEKELQAVAAAVSDAARQLEGWRNFRTKVGPEVNVETQFWPDRGALVRAINNWQQAVRQARQCYQAIPAPRRAAFRSPDSLEFPS